MAKDETKVAWADLRASTSAGKSGMRSGRGEELSFLPASISSGVGNRDDLKGSMDGLFLVREEWNLDQYSRVLADLRCAVAFLGLSAA